MKFVNWSFDYLLIFHQEVLQDKNVPVQQIM